MSHHHRYPAARLALSLAAVLAIAASRASAQTPIDGLYLSPDITSTFHGSTVADEDVFHDDLAGDATPALSGLPAAADLASYHRESGAELLVFDTTVTLPGGLTATPRDVVRWDGSHYSLLLDGAAVGIPSGAAIDVVTRYGSDLLLSLDVDAKLGSGTYADEDLVRYNGSAFASFFDGSATGLDTALDLDAADLLPNGRLLLSFDGSGTVGGLSFDDEDVLEVGIDGAKWQMAYDGSGQHPDWEAADLDVISLEWDPTTSALPFHDGFESGNLSEW